MAIFANKESVYVLDNVSSKADVTHNTVPIGAIFSFGWSRSPVVKLKEVAKKVEKGIVKDTLFTTALVSVNSGAAVEKGTGHSWKR